MAGKWHQEPPPPPPFQDPRGRTGLVNDILQEALLYEGGNDIALFIVWKMLMLNYETEREEDLRYRTNQISMTLIVKAEMTHSSVKLRT